MTRVRTSLESEKESREDETEQTRGGDDGNQREPDAPEVVTDIDMPVVVDLGVIEESETRICKSRQPEPAKKPCDTEDDGGRKSASHDELSDVAHWPRTGTTASHSDEVRDPWKHQDAYC
jgi:hypothetical protein